MMGPIEVKFCVRHRAWYEGSVTTLAVEEAETLAALGICEITDERYEPPQAPDAEPVDIVPADASELATDPVVESDQEDTPAVAPVVEPEPDAAKDENDDLSDTSDGQDNDSSGEPAGGQNPPADKPRRFRRGNRS